MKAVNQSIGNDIAIGMCIEIFIGMDYGVDSGLKYLTMLDPIWNINFIIMYMFYTQGEPSDIQGITHQYYY